MRPREVAPAGGSPLAIGGAFRVSSPRPLPPCPERPFQQHRADCVAHGPGSRGLERRRGRRDPPVGPAARARARGRSAAGSAQPASGAAGAAVSSSLRAAPGKGRLAGATCRAPGALPWPPGRPGSHFARVGSCYAATQPQAELARLVTSSPGAPRPCPGPRRTCRILDLARGPAPGPPRSSGAGRRRWAARRGRSLQRAWWGPGGRRNSICPGRTTFPVPPTQVEEAGAAGPGPATTLSRSKEDMVEASFRSEGQP